MFIPAFPGIDIGSPKQEFVSNKKLRKILKANKKFKIKKVIATSTDMKLVFSK